MGMKYTPIITGKVMIFDLKKPIYGSYYGIWDKWLDIAKKRGLKLVVKTKDGTATFKSAREYLKKSKRTDRFYKNPDEPMIFFCLEFFPEIYQRDKRKAEEKKADQIVQDWTEEGQKKLYEALKKVFKKGGE